MTSSIAWNQPASSLYFSPSVIPVGASSPQFHISILQGQSTGLSVLWNGAPRTATTGANPSFSGGFDVQLSAQDVAAPSMALVSLVDSKTGSPVATGYMFVGYNIVPNDVVYDGVRNRFYITTPSQSNDPAFPPNSLIALDPVAFHISSILAIGNDPTSLALSDDHGSLYVAVDGDGLVKRINLDTFSVISQFQVRPAVSSTAFGYDRSALAVMPGNPQTVALYHHPDIGSSLANLSIFDNGQARANVLTSFDGYDSLLFAPDGKSLFLGSYSNFNSPQTVLRYAIDSTGVPKQTPLSGSGGGPITIENGLLYTSRGTILGIETMQETGLLGVAGGVAVDPANQRILVVHLVPNANSQNYPEYLQAFDLTTQEPLGWQQLDTSYYFNSGENPGIRLIRFGADGLLYTGSQGLLLFHTPLAGPSPVTSAAAVVNAAGQQAASIAPGEILTIYGTNLGPAPAVSATANSAGYYPNVLSNVEVWFDERPGTALLAYNSQINVIAPFEIQPGKTVNVQVWYYGIPSQQIPLTVSAAAPALFTQDGSGVGPVVAVN